eukprot:SAG22_NODE_7541_length_730_cov_0.811410_1_plen_169_part_01
MLEQPAPRALARSLARRPASHFRQCTGPFHGRGEWERLRSLLGVRWASPESREALLRPRKPPTTLLSGGRCVDPESGLDEICDVCISAATGKIVTVSRWSDPGAIPSLPAGWSPEWSPSADVAGGQPKPPCGAASWEEMQVVVTRGYVVAPGLVELHGGGGATVPPPAA